MPQHESVVAFYSNIYESLRYSKISPGWQSSTSHIASNVEKRTAFTLPVFKLERLTLEIPTFAESSFNDIFRSAITRSSLSIIGIFHLLIL